MLCCVVSRQIISSHRDRSLVQCLPPTPAEISTRVSFARCNNQDIQHIVNIGVHSVVGQDNGVHSDPGPVSLSATCLCYPSCNGLRDGCVRAICVVCLACVWGVRVPHTGFKIDVTHCWFICHIICCFMCCARLYFSNPNGLSSPFTFSAARQPHDYIHIYIYIYIHTYNV